MRTTPREVCFKSIKALFKLDEIQRNVLIGTALGDGGLRYRGKDCRLHVKHSFNQISLVEYKRRVFRNITSMGISVFTQTIGGRDYSFAEFVTLTHPEFTKCHNLFYSSSKKIVPKEINRLLTDPLSLAVWLMDDGAADHAGASLQTHSFTKVEVETLIKVLKSNFKLDVTKRMNKGKWIIYFPKASMRRLHQIVDKHMLEDFRYKLVPYSLR